MTSRDRLSELQQLAWSVSTVGPAGHHAVLAQAARLTHELGIAGVAAEVLADDHAPEPARHRALGKVLRDLVFRRPAPVAAAPCRAA